jgi:hypothetical protein
MATLPPILYIWRSCKIVTADSFSLGPQLKALGFKLCGHAFGVRIPDKKAIVIRIVDGMANVDFTPAELKIPNFRQFLTGFQTFFLGHVLVFAISARGGNHDSPLSCLRFHTGHSNENLINEPRSVYDAIHVPKFESLGTSLGYSSIIQVISKTCREFPSEGMTGRKHKMKRSGKAEGQNIGIGHCRRGSVSDAGGHPRPVQKSWRFAHGQAGHVSLRS